MWDYLRTAAEYREQAADCRRQASQADNASMRSHWTELAAAYDQLVEHVLVWHRIR